MPSNPGVTRKNEFRSGHARVLVRRVRDCMRASLGDSYSDRFETGHGRQTFTEILQCLEDHWPRVADHGVGHRTSGNDLRIRSRAEEKQKLQNVARILQKFTAVDAACLADSFGLMYTGRTCKPLTAEEERYRQPIEDRTMRDDEARRVLEGLQAREPFYTRVDWIRWLAALANLYREVMEHISPGPNRRV